MTENSERLKIKRSTLRTAVTKLLNKIEDELSKPEMNLSYELAIGLEQLERKVESLRLADEAYQNTLKTEDLEKEFETAESYQENIIRVKYKATKCIRLLSEKPTPVSDSSSTLDKSIEGSAEINNLRLPKLEIAKFDGKIEDWVQFWSQYESAVHNNNSLINRLSVR